MVERFNGRIAEILRRHRFTRARELEQTIGRYVWLYNHHINQKALGHQPPIGAMKEWHRERPDLFQKKPVNLPGPDSYRQRLGKHTALGLNAVRMENAQEAGEVDHGIMGMASLRF